MNLDVNKLKQFLNKYGESGHLYHDSISVSDLKRYGTEEDDCFEICTLLEENDLEFELVDSGGGEDEGSHFFGVWKIGDVYLKKETKYYSHYGIEPWEDAFEVKPQEKTVTQYV